MDKLKLPPVGWTESPGDWPFVLLVNVNEEPAVGDLQAWVIQFRGWWEGGRFEFIQWLFRPYRSGQWEHVRKAMRIRAAAEKMERVEMFHVGRPPSLDAMLAIDNFNNQMQGVIHADADKREPATAAQP